MIGGWKWWKQKCMRNEFILVEFEIKTGLVVSQLLCSDSDPKMTKFKRLFFMKVVEPCCNVPKK